MLKKALLEPHLSTAALEQERLSLYRQAMEQAWDPEQIKSLYLRVFLDMSHNVIGGGRRGGPRSGAARTNRAVSDIQLCT
ncbi:hypothetical protein ACFSQ7_44400 [Paenibacillus rhizoplanae]